MVVHLVLLKPRPDLQPAERRAFVQAFERAIREIPSVRGVRLGKRIAHGAGYERDGPDVADFMAAIEFEDVAGVQTYLRHPAHEELGRLFGSSLSSAAVYDFELSTLDGLMPDNPLAG